MIPEEVTMISLTLRAEKAEASRDRWKEYAEALSASPMPTAYEWLERRDKAHDALVAAGEIE